jgi:hypothetical protein
MSNERALEKASGGADRLINRRDEFHESLTKKDWGLV